MRNLIFFFFFVTKTQKTKTESYGKENKHLSVEMYLVTINLYWCSRWKKDIHQKRILTGVLKGARSKPNRVIGPKHSPLCGGQWTNAGFCFMGEKKLIAFPSQRLCHPVWTTGKDPLKLCLLIWEWLDYFHLSCQGKYKSRRNSSLLKMNLFILSYMVLVNLHWAVRWPKTDTVCSSSTCEGDKDISELRQSRWGQTAGLADIQLRQFWAFHWPGRNPLDRNLFFWCSSKGTTSEKTQ